MASAASPLRVEFLPKIAEIETSDWQALNSNSDLPDYPFSRYDFLSALESSGCVGGGTGWLPEHLVVFRGGNPVAAMPCYIKSHSYGEYVFDWSWANAYAQSGLDYYPKLISAIPFTPVPGPRLLIAAGEEPGSMLHLIFEAIREKSRDENISGWHLLFPEHTLAESSAELNLLQRNDIQFHWNNQNYQDFDEFLATLRSSKRKQLRRERRIVADQGVIMQRYTGKEITPQVLENFYACYCQTYLRRSGHSGYLNQEFFETIAKTMNEQMMIVVAHHQGQAIAASLFFFDRDNLYGRYWGCIEDIDCLHFEACYYQGIDFAIERKLKKFNPGTQGEHKLVRGFEPTKTYSFHWVKDQRFQDALADFMQQESEHKTEYQNAARAYLPFKRGESPTQDKQD